MLVLAPRLRQSQVVCLHEALRGVVKHIHRGELHPLLLWCVLHHHWDVPFMRVVQTQLEVSPGDLPVVKGVRIPEREAVRTIEGLLTIP
jgi:hypothetical protein